jgi:histone demethylase JARID1
MLAQYGVDDPDDLPESVKGKANSLKRKALNAEVAAAASSVPAGSIMMVGSPGYGPTPHSFFPRNSSAQPTTPGLSNAHSHPSAGSDASSSHKQHGPPGSASALRASSMDMDPSSAHPSLFLRDGAGPGPQLLVSGESTHDLEERLLRGAFDDDELNAHLSTDHGKARVLEILSRTDTGRRRAEEIFGPGVWGGDGGRDHGRNSAVRDNDPIGIGVGNEGDGDDSMFVDLVNQDDDHDEDAAGGDRHGKKAAAAAGAAAAAAAVDHHAHPSGAAEILDEAASWMDARKES